MLKLMGQFVEWAEKRWPEKVVVTEDKYRELFREVFALESRVTALEAKIKAFETNLNNLNMAIGFAAPKMGVLER